MNAFDVAAALVLVVSVAAVLCVGGRVRRLRRELQSLRDLAHRDPLTGLLNRAGLADVWTGLAPSRPAVAVLDLDGFKPVNDTHGHAAGDHVLTVVADRLRLAVAGAAARLGGDEFALILPVGGTVSDLQRLADVIAAPVVLPSGATVRVTASIGLAVASGDLTAVLADADAAMYRAKTTRCTVAVFRLPNDEHTTPAVDPRPTIRVRDRSHSHTAPRPMAALHRTER